MVVVVVVVQGAEEPWQRCNEGQAARSVQCVAAVLAGQALQVPYLCAAQHAWVCAAQLAPATGGGVPCGCQAS